MGDLLDFSITKAFHKEPYPSISPLRPELSQAGKNVLITGGGGGIGLHIAKAFLQASAAKVVVVGRRDDVIKQAAAQLGKDFPQSQVMGLQCDIAKSADVERVWGVLKTQGVHIDVLVLNAAVAPAKFGPILELGTKGVVDIFGINMFGCLEMTEHFHKQEGSSAGSTKVREQDARFPGWRISSEE